MCNLDQLVKVSNVSTIRELHPFVQWPCVTNGMLLIVGYVLESSSLVSWNLNSLSFKAWSLARTTLLFLRCLFDSHVTGWESGPSPGCHDCFHMNGSCICTSQPDFPVYPQPWSIISCYLLSSEWRIIASETAYQKLNFLAFVFPKQASLNLLCLLLPQWNCDY